MKVVPFAGEPGALRGDDISRQPQLLRAGARDEKTTNLESALTGSLAAIPEGYIPRVVLISDGNEGEGSAVRAVSEIQALDIPVDTIPLSVPANSEPQLVNFSIPEQAYANEQVPIDLTIFSSKPTTANVELSADGRSLGNSRFQLQGGINKIQIHARVRSNGPTSVSGRIYGHDTQDLRFGGAIELRRAKVLYISGDSTGSDTNLLAAFTNADYELTRSRPDLLQNLKEFQLVVLNNLDLNGIPTKAKGRLAEYVEEGGGLLLIGGERQAYKDPGQVDPLDRILPARLAPPRKPEGMCVGLIIDKSSSMEGKKIELARLSAIGVVDHLKPTDTIGVLMFDNSFQWAVPMRHAEDKSLIKRLISGITPDGGTQIAPALAEAYRHVAVSGAAYKHIVLLTDGISEEGDSIDLAKEAAQHAITISTVGLGQDVNRSYLDRIAATSGGKAYFLNDPQGLEQILLKDVLDYNGSTAVEKSLTPIVQSDAEILDGIDMRSAPALKGYVRFESKPTSQTILTIDQSKKAPLYVRWQYGLGRVGVFTSDAKSRWAESWMAWPGFDKFWINVSHDLLSHTSEGEARADYDNADGNLLVSYRLGPEIETSGSPPPIFVFGPSGLQLPMDVKKVGPGLYKGSVYVGQRVGLFRIRPAEESKAFPELSYSRQDEETSVTGTNESLLREVASFTGGRFNPDMTAVFRTSDLPMIRAWPLWPGLLALAIALSVAELVVRKWAGLSAWFRGRR
jgi:Ca-activated chloride channel homolog